MDASSMNSAAAMNNMNILQQFSQFLFLQSLAAASVGNGNDDVEKAAQFSINPAATMFGLPQQLQQQQQVFSTPTQVPTSPEASSLTSQVIADLLASSHSLKSQLSPATTISSSSSTSEYSPFKSFYHQTPVSTTATTRQYKVHVNRESAKPLQEWMNANITDPYPSQKEVQELAAQTGFTFKQIRNWFTNSRRRFEQQCAAHSLPLPWIKKDAPKVCRKNEQPTSTPGDGIVVKREECS